MAHLPENLVQQIAELQVVRNAFEQEIRQRVYTLVVRDWRVLYQT